MAKIDPRTMNAKRHEGVVEIIPGYIQDELGKWKIEVMKSGITFVFDTALVMQQPGNNELVATSSSQKHRCFTDLASKSGQGYTVIGNGIVLESDRSDETKHLVTVAWKRIRT